MQSLAERFHDVRARYDEEGFVVVPSVLDRALVQEAQAHVDWLLAKNPGAQPEHLDHHLMRDDPFWLRLISDDRLLDVAEAFIGPDIAVFASHYICKPPGNRKAVLWHQDGSYWPLDPMNVVTLWLAVTDSKAENGCMRVIPRSHLGARFEVRSRDDVPNLLDSGIDEAELDESEAKDVELEAGDVSIHHPELVHGSNLNTSDRWRMGLTIRYIPTTTRILEQPWPSGFLLRGDAVPGINSYSPLPRYVEGRHMPFSGCGRWS